MTYSEEPTYIGTDFENIIPYNENASTSSYFFQNIAPDYLKKASWSVTDARTMINNYYDAYIPRYHERGRNFWIQTDIMLRVANSLPAQYAHFAEPSFIAFMKDGIQTYKPEVFQFLAENGFSAEALAFAKQAQIAIAQGAEVYWDEKIIKDESFKDTKADCVLNELISTNNNLFKKISEAFTNENSEYKIRFSIINNPNDLAEARTSLPNSKGIIEIKLNQSQTSTLSAIDLARIIIHETIHAELHRIKLSNNSGPNPLPSERFNWYITMWEYYEGYYNGNTNRAATASEHNYMAYYYITPIANGLREFDNNSHPVNNYKYLAWTGLQQYGKNADYISEEELINLANLTNIIYSDSHKNNCDN